MTTIENKPILLNADAAVGSTVNAYMFERGITRTQLAKVLEITQPVVSKKLRGQVGWKAEDLAITAAFLGIETADIMPTLIIEDGHKTWIPAPFKPGYAKASSPEGLEANDLVAGTRFELATSGL